MIMSVYKTDISLKVEMLLKKNHIKIQPELIEIYFCIIKHKNRQHGN